MKSGLSKRREVFIAPTAVIAFCRELLMAAGVETDSASIVAQALCYASLRGIDSHGVFLLPHYVEAVLKKRINNRPRLKFARTAAATGVLDADHGFGHHAGLEAIEQAMIMATETGIGLVAVANSSHCGAMGFFADQACTKDMIGLAMTHATARMRSHNGVAPFFGANPIAIACPMQDEDPFCYDGSMTTSSFNAIRLARTLGVKLVPGIAADDSGVVTRDPGAAAQLIPIGGHKGFGLAMVVDIFCALFTGMPSGENVSKMFDVFSSEPRRLGHVFGAIRIDAFVTPAEFRTRLQWLAERVRRQPAADARYPVQIPGDPEKRIKDGRLRNGLPLTPELLLQLDELATRFSIRKLTDRIGGIE